MARKNFTTTLTLDGTERDYACIAVIAPAEPEVNIPADYVEWVEVYDAAGEVVELTDAQHDALVDKANEMLPEWNQEDADHAMAAWEDAEMFRREDR
jgi:hypothetical protein